MPQPAPIPKSLSLSRRLFRLLVIFTIPTILIYLIQAPAVVTDMGLNLAPVTGKVTVDGEPVVSAKVLFVPLEPDLFSGEMSPLSVGRTDPRGEFQLKTLNGLNGAVTGRHLVFVTTEERSETGTIQRTEVIPRDFREVVDVSYFMSKPIELNLKLTLSETTR